MKRGECLQNLISLECLLNMCEDLDIQICDLNMRDT